MRTVLPVSLEQGRFKEGAFATEASDGANGAFEVAGPTGAMLRICATDGVAPEARGWEHVSVSLGYRTPTWQEMCFVKDLFWEEEECVVQFHPPKSEYVNYHPHCLHMWKRVDGATVFPPSILVGPQ